MPIDAPRQSQDSSKGRPSGTIALFDFDGTVTYCDSLLPFLRFAVGRAKFWAGLILLTPSLLRYGLRRIDRARLKEIVLGHYIGGWPVARFQESIAYFATTVLMRLCNDKALARIRWHREQGHRVIVISASPESYLTPWVGRLPIEKVLATRLEIHDGMVSGRIKGRNCRGQEKVARLSDYLEGLDGYEFFAYGDSEGDRELLALATHAYYRPFRNQGAGLTSRLRFLKALL